MITKENNWTQWFDRKERLGVLEFVGATFIDKKYLKDGPLPNTRHARLAMRNAVEKFLQANMIMGYLPRDGFTVEVHKLGDGQVRIEVS